MVATQFTQSADRLSNENLQAPADRIVRPMDSPLVRSDGPRSSATASMALFSFVEMDPRSRKSKHETYSESSIRLAASRPAGPALGVVDVPHCARHLRHSSFAPCCRSPMAAAPG